MESKMANEKRPPSLVPIGAIFIEQQRRPAFFLEGGQMESKMANERWPPSLVRIGNKMLAHLASEFFDPEGVIFVSPGRSSGKWRLVNPSSTPTGSDGALRAPFIVHGWLHWCSRSHGRAPLGLLVVGAVPIPRAAPWAIECDPVGVKSSANEFPAAAPRNTLQAARRERRFHDSRSPAWQATGGF
jgi:hypothetical protein